MAKQQGSEAKSASPPCQKYVVLQMTKKPAKKPSKPKLGGGEAKSALPPRHPAKNIFYPNGTETGK